MEFKRILSLLVISIFVFSILLYSPPVMTFTTYQHLRPEKRSPVYTFGNFQSAAIVPQEPTPCSTCGGGGGGSSPPPSVSYQINVFGGNAKIQIDSSTYSNGQPVTLDASTTYEIQAASIASGYKFFQWEANSGSIDNYEGTPTYLNTGSSSGSLVLVLNATTSNWAGFVQSGSINKVTGEFYIPSASYVSGGTNPNVFGMWVGIGGFGQSTLWQSGVAVNVSSSGVETVTPWYEALPALPVYNNSMHFNPGDLVQVWTNYSNGISTFEIKDYTTGQSWGGSFSYTPVTNAAEWIVENIGDTVPNFGDVTWTVASSNTGNLISPLLSSYQYGDGPQIGGQFSTMYNIYITEPGQFVVNYGGS